MALFFRFFVGLMGLVFLGQILGCRLGNHEVTPQAPVSFTGVYVTTPKKILLGVSLKNEPLPKAEIEVKNLPAVLAQYITNPVGVVQTDPTTGSGMLVSTQDTTKTLPVNVSRDGVLSFVGSTKPQPFLVDPGCLSYLRITEQGALTKDSSVAPPEETDLPISGRMTLQVSLATKFKGTCGDTFQMLSDCYQDVILCGGNTPSENDKIQKAVASLFGPWLDAKLVEGPDIANITEYSYDVFYE